MLAIPGFSFVCIISRFLAHFSCHFPEIDGFSGSSQGFRSWELTGQGTALKQFCSEEVLALDFSRFFAAEKFSLVEIEFDVKSQCKGERRNFSDSIITKD